MVVTSSHSKAGVELYSHAGDVGDCFDCYENENLADKAEYKSVVMQLSKQLRNGWRGAAPSASEVNTAEQ